MKIQTVHVLRYPYSGVGSGAGDRRGEVGGTIPPTFVHIVGATLAPPGSWTQCVHSEKARREGTDAEAVISFPTTWL